MVGSLLVILAFQTPLVSRELAPGTERHFLVTITGSSGEELRYRLRTKIAPNGPDDKDGAQMDIALTDYRATVDGHSVGVAKAGGGLLPIAATGLPKGFGLSGKRGTLWLPLVAFYLPGSAGPFSIGDVPLADGVVLGGKGEARAEGLRVVLDASLSRSGKAYGTLKLDTTLDREGWPLESKGTLVDASGTTRFTLGKG